MTMRYAIKSLFLLAALAASAPVLAQSKAGSATSTAARWALFDTYCSECHNSTDWAGGVAYDVLTPKEVTNDIKLAEHTVRKLRGHLMPPPGSKQPTQAQTADLVNWLETTLDARKETPRAQYVTAQRLNRTEYANAVRTLLAVEVKAEDLLPPDVELEGFDNIAAALTVSPAFLDQYISAARNIAMRATGQGTPKLIKATYGNQAGGGPAPPGANRGMRFRHFFPTDGEYRVSILNDLTGGANTHPAMFRSTVVMFLDGVEFFRGNIGGKEDLVLADQGATGSAKVMARFRNIPVKAHYGYHEILVTTVERSQVLSDANTGGGVGINGANPTSVEVAGPYGEIGFSAGQSRDRVFICYASTEPEEKPCAEKIARNLATQAYRRTATDADVQRLMGFYATGRKDIGNFIGGVQEIVMAVISSPEFLYRTIQPKDDKQKRPQPLTALELASRLSFFLWSDVPDAELRDLAISGKLGDPVVYGNQIKRMLADKRASALVTSFAMRWLNVDDLDAVVPDSEIYARFTPALRDAFATEMKMFLSEVLLENRNVLELLSADYTYVNSTLAQHYGMRAGGQGFTRVQLTDANRFGLLGKGAVLLRTSYPDRTSPVLRGAWVLEKLLNTMTSPPPPGVETNLNQAEGARPTTLRGRLEVHRAAKSCNQCHGVIDPIGLAMENFDVTGAFRTRDNGIDVDASTVLPDGKAITGVSGLREALLANPDQFVQTMVQKLLMYGTGREVEPSDMPQVRQIVRDVKASGNHFFDLVLGVATSDAFKLQGQPHAEGARPQAIAAAK
jgi:mono/diheme cytochrome c family protein